MHLLDNFWLYQNGEVGTGKDINKFCQKLFDESQTFERFQLRVWKALLEYGHSAILIRVGVDGDENKEFTLLTKVRFNKKKKIVIEFPKGNKVVDDAKFERMMKMGWEAGLKVKERVGFISNRSRFENPIRSDEP